MVILVLAGHHALLVLVVVLVLGLAVGLELVLQEPELASLPFPVGLHHLLLHAAVVDPQDGLVGAGLLRRHGRAVRNDVVRKDAAQHLLSRHSG